MKVAIMQPYFLPYIGYFQLIRAVDLFVVYDNIKYTKKGWINRNRLLQNGEAVMFSLPLKADSDFLEVKDRELAPDFRRERLLNQIKGAYHRAPYFSVAFPAVEKIVKHSDSNLFRFLHNSISSTCNYLGISTQLSVSSTIEIDHALKGQDRVLAICKAVGADVYVNPIGGTELYSRDSFGSKGIDLKFLKTTPFEYPQFGDPFVASLSILDVMMFNAVEVINECLSSKYNLT